MIISTLVQSNSRLSRFLRNLLGGKPRHPALQRNHEHFVDLDQERPLTDYDFVVLDTELTGLNPARDEIVSIGAVRIRNLSMDPGSNFYSLVHPRGPMPKLSTLIHRITPDEVKKAPHLHEVLPRVHRVLRATPCSSAITSGWTCPSLNRASRVILNAHLMNPCIDTMRLAQVYQESCGRTTSTATNLKVSYNLRELSKSYGLPLFPEHNAMQDALQTAYLFLFLVKKLKQGLMAPPVTLIRCPWAERSQEERLYHDTEWGVPVRDDRRHFEFLVLEGAQAGLSWLTVLRKREGYRRLFADFDPARVASFGGAEVEALLQDPGIIRNRRKIEATLNNARAFLAIQERHGSFNRIEGALLLSCYLGYTAWLIAGVV